MKHTSSQSPSRPHSGSSQQHGFYWPPYTSLEEEDSRPQIVRGSGIYLYDDTGRRYIDGISGSYNHCLGHSNPGLIATVKEQMDTLLHACNIHSNTVLPEALAQNIASRLAGTGLDRTFLVTSGSEGVEAALKLAWQYQINQGRQQRTRVVAIEGAYHGCTLGAMMATRRPFINEGALSQLSDNSVTMPMPTCIEDLPAWADMLDEHASKIAAIILEPIMGLEGTRQLPEDFLRQLSTVAKKYDIPLICDEVYCGIGRAGTFCESVNQGGRPDIVIFSKCLGGGFPITAVVTTERIADSFRKHPMPLFRHGHTQSGSLLGCRAALFVLDHLDAHHSYETVKARGASLLRAATQQLPAMEGAVSVQGKGLMLSITFDSRESCHRAQMTARRQGVIVGVADRRLKLAPPFTITEAEISELTQRMTGIANA